MLRTLQASTVINAGDDQVIVNFPDGHMQRGCSTMAYGICCGLADDVAYSNAHAFGRELHQWLKIDGELQIRTRALCAVHRP